MTSPVPGLSPSDREITRLQHEVARLRAVLEIVKERSFQRDINQLIREALDIPDNPLTREFLNEIQRERR